MKPITFVCKKTLPLAPEEIANQILDVAKWPDFRGYGPIPGIKIAEFEIRKANIVGSRIRVTNLDGSTHAEEIVEWQGSVTAGERVVNQICTTISTDAGSSMIIRLSQKLCMKIKAGKLDEIPLHENPYADLSSTVIPLFDVVFRQHLSMNSSLLLFKPSMAWFTSFNRRSH